MELKRRDLNRIVGNMLDKQGFEEIGRSWLITTLTQKGYTHYAHKSKEIEIKSLDGRRKSKNKKAYTFFMKRMLNKDRFIYRKGVIEKIISICPKQQNATTTLQAICQAPVN